jgi:hypothetical protein
MSRRDSGPPDNKSDPGSSPGPPLSTPPTPPPPQKRKPAQPHSRPAGRHLGRYGYAWREGFGYGFRDALRLAGRRLPPEYWHVVEALADEFDLAAGDG